MGDSGLVGIIAAQEARFRLLARHAPVGIFLTDGAGKTVFVNDAWSRLTGLSADDAAGSGWMRGLHPDDRSRVVAGWEKALQTGSPSEAEFRFQRPDGTVVWLHGQAAQIREEEGAASGYVGVLVDVTARRLNEAQLREHVDRAEFIGQLSHRLSALSDPQAMIELATEATARRLNANRCYFAEVGDPPSLIVIRHDWHRPGEQGVRGTYEKSSYGSALWWQKLAQGPLLITNVAEHPATRDFAAGYHRYHTHACIAVPYSREGKWVATLVVSDRSPRPWTEEEAQFLDDVVTRFWPVIERARAAIFEITERKRAAENLRARTRTLEILNEVSSTLVAEHDPDRILQAVLAAGREISGAAVSRCERRFPGSSVIRQGDHAGAAPLYGLADSGGLRSYLAVPVISRSGEILGGLYFGHAEPDRFGAEAEKTIIGLAAEAAIAIDNANVYRTLEQRVQERTTSLRDAIAQMEEFSYSVSHDLRAPLRAMNGYAQALLDDYGGKLDATARGYLERIQRSSERMEKLTYDLLTYSRIGRADVHTAPVNLDKMMADIVHQYIELQPPRSVVEIAGPLGDARADESSLAQAAGNLLTNAVKFVPEGVTPRVRIWTEQVGPWVRLWVADNGIGIKPEHQGRLFQVFERLPAGARYEGTGIGLAIVRKAVEKMGGTCGVESDGKSGSRFWLELPKV